MQLKLLNQSEAHLKYINIKNEFLASIKINSEYQDFKTQYLLEKNPNNTFLKMSKIYPNIDEESFNERENELKKEAFYSDLFSNKIKFQEVRNYLKFINEEAQYITMHKTKGSSIENVLVVLEEFFWNKYNFGSIFQADLKESAIKLKNLKLAYVACSRAKTNLRCVRVIAPDEELQLKNDFPESIKVEIEGCAHRTKN